MYALPRNNKKICRRNVDQPTGLLATRRTSTAVYVNVAAKRDTRCRRLCSVVTCSSFDVVAVSGNSFDGGILNGGSLSGSSSTWRREWWWRRRLGARCAGALLLIGGGVGLGGRWYGSSSRSDGCGGGSSGRHGNNGRERRPSFVRKLRRSRAWLLECVDDTYLEKTLSIIDDRWTDFRNYAYTSQMLAFL